LYHARSIPKRKHLLREKSNRQNARDTEKMNSFELFIPTPQSPPRYARREFPERFIPPLYAVERGSGGEDESKA
jgi:hypothetical protein